MTQNVKKPRTSPLPGRRWAAIFLAIVSALVSAAGCHSTDSGGSDVGAAGATACSGDNCQVPGQFTACTKSGDCDQDHGFSCVEGECTYECDSHADCVAVGHCDSRTVDGERKNFCIVDPTPPEPGKLYTSCPNGTECADPALCIGAGPGDLDAYCTIDCSTDDDCAAGYFCSTITRSPCATACKSAAKPSDPTCVPVNQIGDGLPYHCGTSGPERSVCRQREFCSPCSSDADCLGAPNQICAKDASGEKICTRLCDPTTRSCPWGNAATCDLYDDDVGAATCSHKFGSCHGTGKTCEPCRGNADCPGGGCATSQFTGERWCINFKTTCACKNGIDASGACTDGGCPDSPSGLPIECIGDESSSLFDTCYAANSGTETLLGSSPQTGCWSTN